jgi:opacity protein-like surface antigen
MKRYLFAAVAASALLGSGAVAQQTGSHNPVVKDGSPHQIAAPAHGANSFTQAQARGRLEKAGYSQVGTLAKDRNGVWRGMAFKGHAKVRVGVDYKGNVVH